MPPTLTKRAGDLPLSGVTRPSGHGKRLWTIAFGDPKMGLLGPTSRALYRPTETVGLPLAITETRCEEKMGDHHTDLATARAILDGSVEAWHSFVDQYGGLILSVIRRHHFGDEDEIRTVFTDVLEYVYTQALSGYEGRASLATWLAIITRGRTLDHLRSKLGRQRIPAAIEELGEFEQRVFRLYHLEGDSLDALRHKLATEGRGSSLEDVLAAVARIESRLDAHHKRRLAYGCRARNLPGTTGRKLELRDREVARAEEQSHDARPDHALEEQEERSRAWSLVSAALERLSPEEREVLRLKFTEEKTAADIAAELEIESSRRVYTIAERALARLRRWAAEAE